MKRVIRLTERDLTRIVKRVIKETELSSETNMSQEEIKKKANLLKSSLGNCFSKKKYPNLKELLDSFELFTWSTFEIEILFILVIALVATFIFAPEIIVLTGASVNAISFFLTLQLSTIFSYFGYLFLNVKDFQYASDRLHKAITKNPKKYAEELAKLATCLYNSAKDIF